MRDIFKEARWFEEAFLKAGYSPEIARLAFKIHMNSVYKIYKNTDSIFQNNMLTGTKAEFIMIS